MKNSIEKPLGKSLLWKISGKGLTHPSYLYGTMHMICAADFEIKKKVINALKKCDQLIMEFDFTNEDEIAVLQKMHSNTERITDHLNESEKAEFESVVKNNFGLTLEDADLMAPMMLVNMMIIKAIDCEDIKLFETELIAIARNLNISTGGIETATEQLEIAATVFDSKEILRQLKSADDFKEVFKELVYSYKIEELEKIGSFLNDERFLNQETKETLVMERNVRWLKRMPKMMKDKSVFFAVGAGHLTGSVGMIHLLKNKGYSVNPVYENKKL